jgi:hypothetical protein
MFQWTQEDQKMQNEKLEEVVSIIKNKTKEQVSTLAIFDLDGTLFDNRTRTIFILREISEKFDKEVPELVEAFDKFHDLSIIQYGVRETLTNMGLKDEKQIDIIEREWANRFFSDEYQIVDYPLLGAKSYVSRVHEAGATVIYLTGRDVGRMLVGTTECLRMYGFPVGIVGTMMIVKQNVEEEDEIFKRDVVDYLRRLGEVVALYENEPLNINMLHQSFPEALSFFVMTQHKHGTTKVEDGICKIKDFRIR